MQAVPSHGSVANSGRTLTSLSGTNSSTNFQRAVKVCSEGLRIARRSNPITSSLAATLARPAAKSRVTLSGRAIGVFLALFTTAAMAAFTPGNLVILRMGDGSTALTNSGTALFLDEFATNGTFVQTVAIPSSGTNALVASGNATAEASLNSSLNGAWLSLAGYHTDAGLTNIPTSEAATVPRGVGVVDGDGAFTLKVVTTNFYDKANIRSAITDGTNNFWTGGAVSATSTGAVAYLGFDAPASLVFNANIRVVKFVNGEIYFSTAATGVSKFAGAPTSSAAPSSVIPSSGSPYSFAFDATGNTAYIADDTQSALGGVLRYTNSAGTWTLEYRLGSGSTNAGARGLTVDWSGANPVIYATTSDNVPQQGNPANRFIRIEDTGSNSVAQTLVTASANTSFRGIAFTPAPAPTLICASNRNVECGAAWNFDPPAVSASCGGTNFTLAVIGTTTNDSCGDTYSATRTWQITDGCGNSTSCSQTVTVVDTTAPVITGISNLTVECGAPWDFQAPTATDICSGTNVTITALAPMTNALCGNSFAATQTWQATDGCSNSAYFSQIVTVVDTTAPVITCASNRIVECGLAWDFDSPSATDTCEGTNVTVTITATITNALCGNTFSATRTWSATDSCSNSASCSQTITVVDTTAPAITCASNRVVECGDAWTFDAPSATDVCDGTNVTIAITSTITNALCGNTFSATRTWSATDSCSNSTSCSQTITIVDTTVPVITCASNRIVECGDVWTFDSPTASDICDGTNAVITITGTITNALCGNTFSATRTWSAMDSCSNSASCSQTIAVVDTTAPVITCASNRIVECGDVWTFTAPTASDICGGTNVTLTITSTITNALVGETFSATRTWKATDSCSNSATCSQTVTIIDSTPPAIFCSSNIVLECTGPGGTPAFYATTATDVCDSNVTVVCTPPSGSLFSLGTNTILCTATDDSGNTNLCTFTVTILDRTPPIIACPANMIVAEAPRDSGGAAVTFPNPLTTDICDSSLSLVASPPSGSIFPVGTNTVTWTATDDSGNSNSCTFQIRVIPYRLFVVYNTDNAGPGSLRQALLDANDSPDENLIIFTIPGGGFKTIHLLTALPDITSPVVIDGWSQSGSNLPPVVALDGTATSNSADGLVIRSGPSTVRGLAIYGFANAIRIDGAGTNVIQGNYLGVDLTGTNTPGNSADGISLNSSRNRIGGTIAGEGNIIAGNGHNGVTVTGSTATRNSILGNLIFANAALGIDLGNNGATANDADDSDTGANDLQNFPVLTDARSAAGVTTIDGSLTSLPNRTYRLEFFVNDAASTNGEGRYFLGSFPLAVHGSGTDGFSASFPVTLVYTQFITATATDPFGNTSEISPAVQVRTPPVIELQPSSTNAPDGSTVTFCASASGTPPIFYQWRLNGVNIPGATNACLTVSASLASSGTYTVIVANNLGAFATATASLVLSGGNILDLPVGDNFADAIDLSGYGNGTNGIVAGDNSLATFEPPFEPLHAGKPGGRSVWYRWCTPAGSKGIATFRTSGSTFDTLMGVYQGTTLSNLVEVASDEDDGGFYSSECRFNAFYNTTNNSCYYIAVDGLTGVGGPFLLSWTEEKTSHMLPVILLQPASQTVPTGASVLFTNLSFPECAQGHLNCNQNHWEVNNNEKEKLTYQWYFENQPIPGATNKTLYISSVQPQHVGYYRVRVFTPWQYLDSQNALLQINDTGDGTEDVLAFDKLSYVDFFGNPLFIGTFVQNNAPSGDVIVRGAATTIVSGYSGTQIFNTAGSASTPGEVICGVSGGSSDWISFVAQTSGTLFINTDGSSYDTVMAVFRRSPTNSSVLELLACDNNSGTNGRTSSLSLPVEGSKTNYILVDGVNGASGILQLNFSLATTTILALTGQTAQGANVIQVNGRTGLKFTLQGSTNMVNWTPLITATNTAAAYNYTDNGSIGLPRRFYRALILP
ncbi:MAG: HYR domain-containing protein [Verrucomicrobia bacterium]|nr:MAG: HYR domain-containing protein [Verrucomicrobiota bacterium]